MKFYIPKSKRECVRWLREYYPRDLQGQKINWNGYDSSEVKAIYIDYRNRTR